jgi:hypothetical protein
MSLRSALVLALTETAGVRDPEEEGPAATVVDTTQNDATQAGDDCVIVGGTLGERVPVKTAVTDGESNAPADTEALSLAGLGEALVSRVDVSVTLGELEVLVVAAPQPVELTVAS